jgi:proteasome lid subunit RPN8/RPN11
MTAPETLAAVHMHALADYPREACGLVVIVKGRERYWPCRNNAVTPSEHFVLDPEDYAAAEDAGEIVAIVHSHPDVPSRPSEGDRVGCEASGVPWLIVSVMPGPIIAEQTQIAPSGYQAPLVGRSFHHGILDCWSLCRDWYALEMGVQLPNPVRPDNWWDDGQSDLYNVEALRAVGFVAVSLADIHRGDLVLMQIRSRNLVPNHAGIYLGDGLMLHHMHGRLSSRDVFGGYWLENTRAVMRYTGVTEK